MSTSVYLAPLCARPGWPSQHLRWESQNGVISLGVAANWPHSSIHRTNCSYNAMVTLQSLGKSPTQARLTLITLERLSGSEKDLIGAIFMNITQALNKELMCWCIDVLKKFFVFLWDNGLPKSKCPCWCQIQSNQLIRVFRPLTFSL